MLRIGPCKPGGNLRDIGYVDLVPLLAPLDAAKLAHVVRVAIGVDKPMQGAGYETLLKPPAQLLHSEIRALPGFVGREDLMEKIDASLWPTAATKPAKGGRAMLRNSNSGLQAGVMTGLGGVCKTTLATEWAWRNRARYHGVWWLRAETEATLIDDLIELGSRLVPGLSDITDRQAAAKKTLEEIATHREALPWLLVYDNAEGADVMDWTPPAGAHVLLTSRSPDWWGHAAEIDVGVWPKETAVDYLLQQARGSVQNEAATRTAAGLLADEVGCHPLALAIARSHAWGMNWGFDQYLAAYRQQIATLTERDPTKGRAVGYPRSIAATFEIGLEKATATAPKALHLLGICAYLAPDAIPLDLVTEDEMSALEKGEAVAALADAGLVTPETLADGTPGISMHRLVQAVMRARLTVSDPPGSTPAHDLAKVSDPEGLTPSRTVTKLMAAIATRLVADAFPNGDRLPSDVRHWPACQRLANHARTVLENAPDAGEDASHTSLLAGQVAIYLRSRADHAAAEPHYRRALAIDEASYGPDHPHVALRLNNLAALLQATNRLGDAEPLMRRALSIDEASFGPDHPDVAVDLNNLAQLLQATNRLMDAEPLMRRALEIDEASFGPDHPKVAVDLNNLALLLQDTNRLGDAEPLMRRALAIGEACYGLHHPDVGLKLWSIGNLLQALGRLDEALPFLQRAVRNLDASELPADHSWVTGARNNLAALEAEIEAQKGEGPGEPSPGQVQGGSPAARRGAPSPTAPPGRSATGPWWRRFLGQK